MRNFNNVVAMVMFGFMLVFVVALAVGLNTHKTLRPYTPVMGVDGMVKDGDIVLHLVLKTPDEEYRLYTSTDHEYIDEVVIAAVEEGWGLIGLYGDEIPFEVQLLLIGGTNY